MIPSLARLAGDAEARSALARQLRRCPHVWPRDDQHDALAWARDVSGLDGPPSLAPATCAAITVHGQSASLWMLDARRGRDIDDRSHRGETVRPDDAAALGAEAVASWRTAALALPRALPVLWQPVRDAVDDVPTVTRVETFVSRGVATHEAVIDGPSFGLTFFLALASRVLGVNLPDSVVASAALADDGRVSGVHGLERKVACVQALAPRVRRFLVAAGQERSIASEGFLEIVPVRSAAEALECVFGPDRLAQVLVDAGDDPARRDELARSFFRLALAGRGAAVDWTPVEQGAALALERWSSLEASQRFELEFARAVAARHERNAGAIPVPSESWLAEGPLPVRVQVVTHIVQQSADVGVPSAGVAETLAERFRAAGRVHEAFVPQLKLEGALARLWAVTGRAKDALAHQERLARALADTFEFGGISFPLAEWYRLSGLERDPDAFERAERFRDHLVATGALGLDGSPYVQLARARAMVCLDRRSPRDPSFSLVELATRTDVPSHVRWSAARWALRDGTQRPGPVHVSGLRTRMRETLAAGGRDAVTVQTYLALVALDRAVGEGDIEATAAAIEALRALEPGLVGHLTAGRPEEQAGAWVAEAYPY